MPLVRVEVRNEYALGAPELYREANREDPKEILQGVAVAGLVGVLRQLGDLAEFAAEVFHGLQEEVAVTSSRSNKLMARVQRIEAALSPLEKAVLAQRSHLHFAYTAGSNWHARIRCAQNHFVYSDLPQFIMDSYEECRGLPRLDLLDRFDPGGPGSCLKRYSDPTFFKRAAVASGEASTEKILKDKKGRKIKKRRSWPRSGKVSRHTSFSYYSGRMQFTQLDIGGHASPSQTASTYDTTLKSDLGDQSNLGLRNGPDYIEGDFRPSYSLQSEEQASRESISSPVKRHDSDYLDYDFLGEKIADAYDDIQIIQSQEQAGCSSSSVTWDEKIEPVEPTSQDSNRDNIAQEDNQDRLYSGKDGMAPEEDHNRLDSDRDGMALEEDHKRLDSDKDGMAPEEDHNRLDSYKDGMVPEEDHHRLDSDKDGMEPEEDHYRLDSDKDGMALEEDHYRLDSDKDGMSPEEDHYRLDPDKDGMAPEDDHNRLDSDEDGMAQEDDHNRHLESFSSNLDLDAPGDNAVDSEIVGKMDVQSSNQAVPTLESGDVHLDDIESETDNFMDALNTIESESETDIDSTKKQKADNCSKLEDKEVGDGVCELIGHKLECESSSAESNVLAKSSPMNGCHEHNLISASPTSYAINNSVDQLPAADGFNSVSIVDRALQSSQRAGETLSSVSPQIVDSYKNGNIDSDNNVESVSCIVPSNCRDIMSEMPITDRTRISHESHKHAPETSNVTSVTFWTNGGLLGLQPSKPPDFSVANAPQDPVYKKDGKINSSIQQLTLTDKDAGKPGQTENYKNTEGLDMDNSTCHEHQESGALFRKASWKISPADLDIKLGKFGDSLYQNNASFTGSSVTASGSYLPDQNAKKHQENARSLSRISELSNRLLSTGSNKKLLPSGNECSYSASYQNANPLEQKNHRSVAYRTFSGRSKDIFGGESPTLSPSSSPPLEHMKISFQPIDGFETSKLKLKFPDGNMKSESSSDIFASFQLVPEVSITRRNVDSDSDSDTFYRSSPSVSDDCHSNQSDSNSEQWESSESPTSKNHDLYDALRRISLTESVSTVPEICRTNHEGIRDNNELQIPFVQVGTTNHSFSKEPRNNTSQKGLVGPEFVPTPAPPPLPPVQWRGTMLHLDGVEDTCGATEGSHYAFDIKLSASTISQPKPAPLNEDQIDTPNIQKSKKSSFQKSNGQKEANQGKSINEKEDFLHQIRAKSFNLRPTVTTKPTVPSAASPAVPVTAILKKANAIRQAVASDGEDNWSDT